MFRPSPTWISLPAHEVYQILQAIYIRQALLRQFAAIDVSDSENLDEYYGSPPPSTAWSSSDPYTMLGDDMRSLGLCTGTLTSTGSREISLSISDFTENSVPAREIGRIVSGRAIRRESGDLEDAYSRDTVIPDSVDSTDSLTPIEESSSGVSHSTTARSYTASNSTLGIRKIRSLRYL